jgi:hypothetical protein
LAVQDIALRRLRVLVAPSGKGAAPKNLLTFQAELTRLGFRVKNAERFADISDALFARHGGIVEELKAMRGGDVD